MLIKPALSVVTADHVKADFVLQLALDVGEEQEVVELPRTVAYVPLINSHDHLIGNWVPRAGDHRPYPNSHVWVEDMKDSFSFRERDSFWTNDGSFNFNEARALKMAALGCYKNLFSGCGRVMDHAPVQDESYYHSLPIHVIDSFRQCHSLTLGNWWGGGTASEEMELSKGKMPFVIHLGEGIDEVAAQEFATLEAQGLLQKNSVLIHGIAFTKEELARIAAAKASVCWCPGSNYFLIGQTLKVEDALEAGVNVVLGTDSTMSGTVNMASEFNVARQKHPQISAQTLYRMVTENAVKAMMLPQQYAALQAENCRDLLLVDQVEKDPFENLMNLDAEQIKLFIVNGKALMGDVSWAEELDLDEDDYSFFRVGRREKFVIGDPMDINDEVDEALGYHKSFAYLPF